MESLANRKSASKRVLSLSAVFTTICILTSTVVSLGAISAKAVDPAETTTISRATIADMLYAGGLSGQYLASDNTYQSFSWQLNSSDVEIINDCVGVGNVGANSQILWYQYDYSGWNPHVDSYGAQIQVPINLHFQNVKYISFNVYWGCVTGAYGANKTIPLASAQQYNTLCCGAYASDLVPVSARYTDNSVPAWCIAPYRDGEPQLGMMHVEIENATAGDMYIGDLNAAWLNPTWRFNKIYFGITDIEISNTYTYAGRHEPPPYPTIPSGEIPGSGSGTIVTDTSGNINFDFHMTQVLPEYIYQGSYSVSSEDMPQTISSAFSALDTYGTSAVAAVSEFAADVDAPGLLGQMSNFLTPKLIVYIMGINALCIVGWILTRYGGGGA